MKTLAEFALQYLTDGWLAQLATVRNDQPWVCTVYFVVDDELNMYWLSYPTRRHSQDIAVNSRVAMTVVVKPDVPVIGVQAEGEAQEITDAATAARVMKLYVQKYGVGRDFLKRFKLGTHRHRLYQCAPSRIVLFDEMNYGPDNAQELKLR